MSIPSVIFADANWYGSLRGVVEVGGGNDAKLADTGSRWGIKGTSEISDGLSAVYNFETTVNTSNASAGGGRHAYAGLSGGFGNLTIGHTWKPSMLHVGFVNDKSTWLGTSGVLSPASPGRQGMVAYSYDAGAVSMGIGAMLDPNRDSGDGVDEIDFGMTFSLGDIGKIGLAYANQKDHDVEDSAITHELVSGEVTGTVDGGSGTATGGYKANFDVEYVPSWKRATLPAGLCYTAAGAQTTTHTTNLVSKSACEDETGTTGQQWVQSPTATIPDNSKAWVLSEKWTTEIGAGKVDVPMADVMITQGTGDDAKMVMSREILVYQSSLTPPTDEATRETLVENKLKSDAECSASATAGDCAKVRVFYTGSGDDEVSVNLSDVTETLELTLGSATTGGDLTTDLELANTDIKTKSESSMKKVVGFKRSNIAVEFNVGGLTPTLGYSQKKMNDDSNEKKTTHFGLSGAVGDTGMSFHIQGHSIKNSAEGMEDTNPWLVNVSKSLGGGASVWFEHADADDGESGTTHLGLMVNF